MAKRKTADESQGVLRSMTGFGGAQAKGDGIRIAVDLRSVNHRYFKLMTRVPDEIAPLAGPAEAAIRKVIKRGSVSFAVRLEIVSETRASQVDEKLLSSYAKLCRTIRAKHDLPGAESPTDLLNLPGVIMNPEEALKGGIERHEKTFRLALKKALVALMAMREKEGKALQRELTNRIAAIERRLGPIQKMLPQALQELEKRLFDRVEELLRRRGLTLNDGDLARETAIQAERTDVTEELERLRSHTSQAKDLITAGGEIGRRLDFLAQEMLREATTMAAKVGSCRLAERVLDLKVDVDRLKEQVQNIE